MIFVNCHVCVCPLYYHIVNNCLLLWSYDFVCLSAAINKAAEAWGVDCKRYEIRELTRLN